MPWHGSICLVDGVGELDEDVSNAGGETPERNLLQFPSTVFEERLWIVPVLFAQPVRPVCG